MAPSAKSNSKLPRYVRCLPVGHLQLQIYTTGVVRRHATIGSFLEAFSKGKKDLAGKPGASAREQELVFKLLFQSRKGNGAVDWDAFRQSRVFKIRQGAPLYFFSHVLEKLKPTQSSTPITRLHFSRRTLNALLRKKISTVKELHNRTREGLGRIQALGILGSIEIIEALTALSINVCETGDIDWIGYAKTRGYLILPLGNRDWSPRAFVRDLPAVAEAAVINRYGAAAGKIFRQRSLSKGEAVSFTRIGRRLGQTKQHTNVIEKRTLRMLRRVLLREEYHDYNFHVCSEFSQPLRDLAKTICIKPSGITSSIEWNRQLGRAWGFTAMQLGEAGRLVLQILDIRLVLFKAVKSQPLLLSANLTGSVRPALRQIEYLLTRSYPNGLSSDRLETFFRKKLGSRAPSVINLTPLLESISGVEMCKGVWRAVLSRLGRMSDRCERVLKEKGKPMHFREIASAVDPKRARSDSRFPRKLSAVLSMDGRFVPITRSGCWALKGWHGISSRYARCRPFPGGFASGRAPPWRQPARYKTA